MNSIHLETVQKNKRFANLVACIQEITDSRIDRNKEYSLECIVIIAICAMLGGANNMVEVANFAEDHFDWFSLLFNLNDHAPSHDTFSRVFEQVYPNELQFWLTIWLEGSDYRSEDHIAIDGKVIRAYSKGPLCIVRAWIDRLKTVVASVRVGIGSNEITAIPKILDMLCLKGKIITIDAIGAQKNIISKIRAHGADYLITLKGNQHQFYQDVKDFMIDVSEGIFNDVSFTYSKDETCGHGRREIRECWATDNIEWLEQKRDWEGLRSIAIIKATVHRGGKIATSKRCYITSLPPNATNVLRLSRAHWMIESMHWHLDTDFNEDKSTIRKAHGPVNVSTLRSFTLSCLKRSPIQRSVQGKRNMITANRKALWETLIN